MKSFIVLTFAFMFWAFYEFSGGSEFEPLEESPFAEGREVDMTPMAPAVTVATKSVEEETPLVLASAEVAVDEPADKTLPADTAERVTLVLEPTDKALDLTEPEEAPEADVVARLDVATDTPLVTPEPEAEPDLRQVTGSRVNMRAGPGTNFEVLAKLVRGDEVEVLRVEEGWARLRAPDGRVGWMAARLLTPKAE